MQDIAPPPIASNNMPRATLDNEAAKLAEIEYKIAEIIVLMDRCKASYALLNLVEWMEKYPGIGDNHAQ